MPDELNQITQLRLDRNGTVVCKLRVLSDAKRHRTTQTHIKFWLLFSSRWAAAMQAKVQLRILSFYVYSSKPILFDHELSVLQKVILRSMSFQRSITPFDDHFITGTDPPNDEQQNTVRIVGLFQQPRREGNDFNEPPKSVRLRVSSLKIFLISILFFFNFLFMFSTKMWGQGEDTRGQKTIDF